MNAMKNETRPQMQRRVCLPGDRYGRLLVIREAEKSEGSSQRRVHCLCDCGTRKSVQVSGLTSGKSKSCGCLHREKSRDMIGTLRKTHGEAHGTPEYRVWKGIRDRCNRSSNKSFPRYGGRGIVIAPEWSSYEVFLADMGRKPGPKFSIDRIDRNGPYSKENCRWADLVTQANNTSRNRVIEIDGKTKTISQWSRVSGVPAGHIWARLNLGWKPSRAVFEPTQTREESMRSNRRNKR